MLAMCQLNNINRIKYYFISAHEIVVSVCQQPYMALLSWRGLTGDSFDITRLPEALDECGHSDLADLACRILNSRCPCIGNLWSRLSYYARCVRLLICLKIDKYLIISAASHRNAGWILDTPIASLYTTI